MIIRLVHIPFIVNSWVGQGRRKRTYAVPSRPVDPGQHAAQLREIANNQDALPQALSRPSRYSRCSTVEVDWDEEGKKHETIVYNDLVNDSGRPAYPIIIDLLEEVPKNPAEYREMLRLW